MIENMAVEAVLCLTGRCPHCPAMMQMLSELLKSGRLARLTLVNLDQAPEMARELGVRSVPWVRIGAYELTGMRSAAELDQLVRLAADPDGLAEFCHGRLRDGDLEAVLVQVRREPNGLAGLLPIIANPEASLNVRIGAGAVFEAFQETEVLAAQIPALGKLARHPDARVRADACYYLGLAGRQEAADFLKACLQDSDPEVSEIAAEGLAALPNRP